MAQNLFRSLLSTPVKRLTLVLHPRPSLLLYRVSALPCRRPWCTSFAFPAMPSQTRTFFTTQVCLHTFNVQDEDDFQDRVLKSQKPVVIDFHAQWCGPCKILGPRLEKVVSKHEGKILMAKVDIDDHTDLALEYEWWDSIFFYYRSCGCGLVGVAEKGDCKISSQMWYLPVLRTTQNFCDRFS
uniref:Thioredoxin 2 n=1 Tax=Laticauda laticaudata TaxID=8630 RepID=A0A8C5RSU9_LATLA